MDTTIKVHNPLPTEQRFVEMIPVTKKYDDGSGRVLTFQGNDEREHVIAPGATIEVDAALRFAIHRYTCTSNVDACKRTGCRHPDEHRGVVIVGGLAPRLVVVGHDHPVDSATLDACDVRQGGVESPLLEAARARRGSGR